LASFAGIKGTPGTPGTVDEKGKPLEKQKIAVSYRSDKKDCPLGSVIGLKLTTSAFSVTYKGEFQR
jgi:hypothetical protein